MRSILFACSVAAAFTLAAGRAASLAEGVRPEGTEAQASKEPELVREKRSHHSPSYGVYQGYQAYSPCGSAPIPAYAPGPYQVALGPSLHGYGHHHGYGIGLHQHYRAEEPMEEFLNQDMEGFMSEPSARWAGYGVPAHVDGYGLPAHLSGLTAPVIAPVGGGAVGVFPNANSGGCSLPLLFSCSPSVVPGRLVKQQYAYGAPVPAVQAPPAYRGVDESLHHETLSEHHEDAVHDLLPSAHDMPQRAEASHH